MRLFFRKHVGEFLVIGHTPACKHLQQSDIAVIWLYSMYQMFSLQPSDATNISNSIDEHVASIDSLQQLNHISSQLVKLSIV